MRNLIEFIKRNNYILLFILLELSAVLLAVTNSYYQNAFFSRIGNAVAGKWYSNLYNINSYLNLRTENDRLARENAELRAQVASSYLSYNTNTFTVNDTIYNRRYSYIEAEVIKNSRGGLRNYLMINRGNNQGVKSDMAVISPTGIVGIVVGTTSNFATIMPVIHPDSRNSVKIKRTGINGTLVWEGGDYRYAVVSDIPTTHKLYKNDTVITSGFANDFPEGIAVGYVEALQELPGTGFYNVIVRLATDFGNLNHVYIINNYFRSEQDSLSQRFR